MLGSVISLCNNLNREESESTERGVSRIEYVIGYFNKNIATSAEINMMGTAVPSALSDERNIHNDIVKSVAKSVFVRLLQHIGNEVTRTCECIFEFDSFAMI